MLDSMALNPTVMQAIEKLNYRVTIGDVASQAGLDVKLAEREILALASDAGGHLQVAESGEIAYLFPRNFRGVLRNKFLKVRLQEWWKKAWGTLFYLIRISFGILLILSIVLIVVAIVVILAAMSSNRSGNDDRRGGYGGGMVFMPRIWIGPNPFWIFSPNYGRAGYRRQQQRSPRGRAGQQQSEMNFLEAVFSFLFGDGNPNADLEVRRWRSIATVIRNNGGAIAAEQVAPYLDNISDRDKESEDYMLPVLLRFNGRPEVSPEGQIVYHFPALQVTATQQNPKTVSAYLKEQLWQFSATTSEQKTMAIGLGVVNFVGALVLGNLLQDQALIAQLGPFIAFVDLIYPLLLAYGAAFLSVPLIRHLWIQRRNKKVEARNQQRQERAVELNEAGPEVEQKIAYARQFAAETVVSADDLAYSTEMDLLDQEAADPDRIDAEWRKRLESGS